MSTEDDNLFEQELPLYNETPKPLILKKEPSSLTIKDSPYNDQEEATPTQNTSGLTIKSPAKAASIESTEQPRSALKIKKTDDPSPTLRIRAFSSEETVEPKNISKLSPQTSASPEPDDLDHENAPETPSHSYSEESHSPSIKALHIKNPSNSDSIKNLEYNKPVPEPGEHAPQTIILRNKPLPGARSKLALTTVEPVDDQYLSNSLNTPPPHIQELEEYEEVLNTAAQESVFELSNNELNDQENSASDTQEELFNQIHTEPDTDSAHKKNSPTIYEMEDDSSIGTMLMSARQKASFTIKELARRTNIKEAYIIALEEENRSNLPDPIYTKSYIKNLCHELEIEYPKALKLYANLCGEEFDTQYNIAQRGPDKYASKPANSTLQKWSAIVVIFIILGLITFGFTAKHFYSPLPVFKENEQVNLNDFHQKIIIPTPRLNVPNK
ncbi:helix-turn-helix domain-containing protein [Lentisphaera profundi]|uniref:Helix-turn-helix domain-containing protein n=1 Tax=Lentisphaera profundi TaxID=1658616 RepID=A0ABY7VW24_9BACT|nr:helix-turn-helix domain-containing protein [Lentisphaera profundi]WDE98101.1 helix-turn-helix domain-containing protein [Lentisphaera profundi]